MHDARTFRSQLSSEQIAAFIHAAFGAPRRVVQVDARELDGGGREVAFELQSVERGFPLGSHAIEARLVVTEEPDGGCHLALAENLEADPAAFDRFIARLTRALATEPGGVLWIERDTAAAERVGRWRAAAIVDPDLRDRVARRIRRFDAYSPYWAAQLTVFFALALYLSLYDHLLIINKWPLAVAEGVTLVGLLLAKPRVVRGLHRHRRHVVIWLVSALSIITIVSLTFLNHRLLTGHEATGGESGHNLILTGVVLWVTNVLVFALWYFELDRGGPVRRRYRQDRPPDFLFPQMTDPEFTTGNWQPSMIDYLYLSLCTATAFSPTDALPMTTLAKVLMAAQTLVSLSTVGLVVARAVNILG